MVSLRSKQLLINAAKTRKTMKENVSKKEIKQKISEIKYLASQKNVPKLSLRKEIIHLEKKLEGVFEIEKALLKEEKKESAKITSLKRQIGQLKRRLDNSKDEELREKVNKLSHLLGDAMAKSTTAKDVRLTKKIRDTMGDVKRQRRKVEKNDIELLERIELILKRVQTIKNEIEIKKHLEQGHPEQLKAILHNVTLLEQKLLSYKQKHQKLFGELPEYEKEVTSEDIKPGKIKDYSAPDTVKHNILITPTDSSETEKPITAQGLKNHFEKQHIEVIVDKEKIEQEVIKELPLPPPPKIARKKHKK